MGDVVETDLTDPGVHVDLLTPGVIAASAPVAAMADRAGAIAGINGDFFDIGRTSAPAGPAVMDGRPLKAAAPEPPPDPRPVVDPQPVRDRVPWPRSSRGAQEA